MHKPSPRLFVALEFLLYAVLAAVMLRATWLTWPDAFIDFSRELYLPWRVSCGDVLYRDLAYFFGPLSVWLNAALFALLGHPSVHALFALNFAFWVATLLALRALLRRIASPPAATAAVAAFILLFSFNRYLPTGNYNFLAPYVHELPRGFLLALLSLLALDSALRRPSPSPHLAALSGALFGLTLFTKPEVALASGASLATLAAFALRKRRDLLARTLLPALGGLLAALAVVLLPLAFSLGSFSRAVVSGLLRPFLDCVNPAIASLPFFRSLTGLDAPLANALRMAGGAVLAAAPFLAASVLLPRIPARPARLAVAALLAAAAAAIGYFAFFPLGRALPLVPLAILVLLAVRAFRPAAPASAASPSPATPLAAAFAVFAFLLALKMLLNASVSHYGFVLLLPSFLLAVVFALSRPRTRCVAAALLLAFAARALCIQHATLRAAACVPVAGGAYRAPKALATYLNASLAWIGRNLPPGATLAVLPEGAVLNVLSGHPNSTPYPSLSVADHLRFGDAAVLDAFRASPPDAVLLVRKDLVVQPEPRFGLDYAQPLMAFLDANFAPALTLPVQTPSGIQPFFLLARRIPPG